MSLSSTGTLNASILQEAGSNLSSKYLTQANATSTYQPKLTFNSPLLNTANTVSIDLSLYDTVSARNTALSSYLTSNQTSNQFLLLSGGALTGALSTNSQITGFTTLNGTTGIFGTISTTNNTNQAIPAVGNFGGTGDKIVIYNGTPTTYPYSIGYETNSLWISSPNTIKLYNNGVNSLAINSSGNVGIGTTPSSSYSLDVKGNCRIASSTGTVLYIGNGSTPCLLNLWDASGSAWQISTQGGLKFYNGDILGSLILRFQILSGGNVGINTTPSTSYALSMSGSLSVSSGSINIFGTNTNNLVFDNNLNNYKIQLYSGFGFGIASSTLMYISGSAHNFYNSGTSLTTPIASIDGSGNISASGNATITGSLSCSSLSVSNRFYTTSLAFLFVGGTTYCAGFFFNNVPSVIQGKTFIIDGQITQSSTTTSTSYGFTQIVNNYGAGNGVVVKTLNISANTAINWYNGFTNWYDGLNVYTYGTSLPTTYCYVRISVLG